MVRLVRRSFLYLPNRAKRLDFRNPAELGRFLEHLPTDASDDNTPIIKRFQPENTTLVIVFGGILGGMSVPFFEFFKILSAYPVNVLFTRDLQKLWYHKGLLGVTDNLEETVDFFQAVIAYMKPKEIIGIGNSAGGFSTIFFGCHVPFTRIYAFNPQCYLDAINRKRYGSTRGVEEIGLLHAYAGGKSPHLDLRNALAQRPRPVEVHVHYSLYDDFDPIHANHIKDFEGVYLHGHDHNNHSLVPWLRDKGELRTILDDIFLPQNSKDGT